MIFAAVRVAHPQSATSVGVRRVTRGSSSWSSSRICAASCRQRSTCVRQSQARVIRAAIIGTVVEYYDFGIYG